jgi:hypothetical protein
LTTVHLYDEAVTVEGVGEGDYCGQVCFKSPYHGTVTIEDVGESPLLLSNDVLQSLMKEWVREATVLMLHDIFLSNAECIYTIVIFFNSLFISYFMKESNTSLLNRSGDSPTSSIVTEYMS